MAILKAPLLALRASNQLGKAIAYRSMRGNNVACAYAQPSDPQTAAQLTQRSKIDRTVDFWKVKKGDQKVIDAWHRYAKHLRKPWAAYQTFIHFNTLWPLSGDYAGAWYLSRERWNPGIQVRYEFSNINTQDGFTANIETMVWIGDSPTNMQFAKNDNINIGGRCSWQFAEMTTLPLYYQISLRTGEPLTGIHKFIPSN